MTFDKRSSQCGLSLIELMVAITLGLMLSLVVIQVFLSSRGVFRMQDSVSKLQETGRFAVGVLAQDVRMAGYMGCPSIDRIPVNNIASGDNDYDFGPDTVLLGNDNVAAGNTWAALPGTDVLTIRKAANGAARLAGNTDPNNANIQIANDPGLPKFQAGDLLMITDCVSADIFRATNVSNSGSLKITMAHASSTNITNKLSKSYGTDAEVLLFQRIEYFVRQTDRSTKEGRPINSLFVRTLTTVNADGSAPVTTAYELVEGVQNMQLEYGVDTVGDDRAADVYRSANQIAAGDWSKVVTVRINLLLHGNEDNATNKSGDQVQNLEFMGTPVANDGRLRQVFRSTVAVRNRIP